MFHSTDGPSEDADEQTGWSYVSAVAREPLRWQTVGEALDSLTQEHGNRRAVVWLTRRGTASMTWREVIAGARGVAAELVRINPDRRRVVLAAGSSPHWVVAMYGCALAGMAVVPISPRSTRAEARHILEHSQSGVVLASNDGRGHSVAQTMDEAAGALCDPPLVRDIARWPTAGTGGEFAPAKPTDEFLVQYTSGSTGEPKGARLSHLAVLNCARFFADGAGARAGDVWLNPLPVYHVGGFVSGVLSCLAVAGTYVALERFTPDVVITALREFRPALVGLVPTMLIDLLQNQDVSDRDFESVRVVIGGATDVDRTLVDEVERRLRIRFLVGYGQSESPCMAMSSESDDAATRTRTLGRPLPGRDYYLCDESGSVVRSGADGELCVRGPLDMLGYLDDSAAERAIGKNGWRATGDLCSLDDAGVLTFRGRKRDVIIRGGTNIYPGEVEHALSAHPAISEIAVFGVPDDRLGERVVAALIPHTGAQPAMEELSAFAESLLGHQKRPTGWMIVQDFPRTNTGKVRKHVLRQMYKEATIG